MKYRIFLLILLIPFIFSSCRKDYEFQNFDYKTYNRVIGTEGGVLNFYANYANDTINQIIVKLNVPSGALDSLMVFNMYQFEDYELAKQMEDGFAKIGSKFLYFVPFYESEGYHERGQMELNYHMSVQFKDSVTVNYRPLADNSDLALKSWQEVELYNNFYKTTNKSYKVYRIKIPKIDQWGESKNIYVNWTRQGYPNGYDATSLSYLISGKWTASSAWGTGETSMENWELVGNYNLNTMQDLVSFKIASTDYIYVVARDIFIPLSTIPLLLTYVNSNFQNLQVKRASFDENNYKIYLSNNSIAVFDQSQNFQYLLTDNLAYVDLPRIAQSYIKQYFSNYEVKKVSLQQSSSASQQYEAILSSGIKLYFNGIGGIVRIFQYGFAIENLPALAKNYLQAEHRDEIITNVNYDSTNIVTYTAYLSSGARVFFDEKGSWTQTLYFKINSDKLPDIILNYFSTNYPNAIYSEINHTIWPGGSSIYDIKLVNKKWFQFSVDGTLLGYEIRNLAEKDLPLAIIAFLSANSPNKIITNINHIYTDNTEWFEIYFSDLTIIRLDPQGKRI